MRKRVTVIKSKLKYILPTAIMSLLLLFGCKPPFQMVDVLDGTTGAPLTISPVSAQIARGETLTLTASGGKEPYSFTIREGNGQINIDTGEYTAPVIAGSDTIDVTDAYGTVASATITISESIVGGGDSLSISPSAITLAATSTVTFSASGGSAPYIFSAGSGTIDAGTGAYSAPASAGSDTVTVTDSAGATASAAVTVLSTAGVLSISPASMSVLTSQTVDFEGAGGIPPYTFLISSVGSGSPTINSSTGFYTAGGSAGTDTIEIRDSATPQNVKTATVTVSAGSADVNYDVTLINDNSATHIGGDPVSGDFTVQNIGTNNASLDPTWEIYVSTDAVLSAGDTKISGPTAIAAAGLAAGASVGPIAFGGTWPTIDGTYYLIASVSSAEEVDLTDNAMATGFISITGSPPPDVDYAPATPTSIGSPAVTGSTINETFSITNSGGENGSQDVFWSAYISTDTSLDAGDTIIDSGSISALNASQTSGSISIDNGLWPSTPGSYYLIANVAAGDDNNSTNDSTASGGFTVNAPVIDYQPSVPSQTVNPAITESSFSETFTIQNAGGDDGTQTIFWTAYISTDTNLDGSDTVIDNGSVLGGLTGGSTSAAQTINGTWPAAANTYYLIVDVFSSDETVTGNNQSNRNFTINLPDIDYIFTALTNGNTPANAGTAINETFTIENQGGDGGSSNVNWAIYISSDGTWDAGDTLIKSGSFAGLASTADSGAVAITGANWPSTPGTYYLTGRVWADDETVPGNNTFGSGGFTINEADIDYTVPAVTPAAPAGGNAGDAINETFDIYNNGSQNGSSTIYWTAYASTDTTVDAGDTIVKTGSYPGGLNVGATASGVTISGCTWPSAAGTWYLLVEVSASDENSGKTANNSGASAAVTLNSVGADYTALNVSAVNTPANVNDPFSETFDIQNVGNAAGTGTVYWTAYRSSDTVLDGGDTEIDSGTIPPLGSGASSTGISIYENPSWPTGGTWYVIVQVSAADDIDNSNNTDVSTAFTINVPSGVDYAISNMTKNFPIAETGGLVSESFDVTNIGDTTGGAGTWAAYASTNTVIDGDPTIDSGSISALGIGGSETISIAGNWPASSGTYNIIVEIAGDDISTNNINYIGTFQVNDPPDYTINTVVTDILTSNTGGNLNELISTASGGGTHSFYIENIAASPADGNQTISWGIYLSTDTIYDAGDTIVQTGTNPPLAAGNSVQINFDGNLPPSYGEYYFLIRVTAGDEVIQSNNLYFSPSRVYVWDNTVGASTTNKETDELTGATYLSDAEDYAVLLNPTDEVYVDAIIDDNGLDDLYKVTLGASTTELVITATWANSYDDLDIDLYDSTGTNIDFNWTATPDIETLTSSGLTPNSVYYVSILSCTGSGGNDHSGTSYLLSILGN